ncbi:hypothetical protein FXO37_30527 [Capsicum annuum]|nr:hypothetical protein FXO37_30527 [Capsicum annuum]
MNLDQLLWHAGCFGLEEFAIVVGLRCHHPEEPPIAKGTPCKRSKSSKRKKKIDGLFDIARRGNKASDLLTDLMDKTIPKEYMEQLCLVWFTHSVILERDVSKVIEDDLLARAEDFDKFNNYSWGYDNFYLTAQYLLTKLTSTLYGFPWLFMVVHPRIVPTEEESLMTSYITLGYVDTIADPTIELIRKELARATVIRRTVRQGQPNVEALHDQLTKADLGASASGVIGVGGPSHTSSPSCSRCECGECKYSQDKLFENVEAISKVIKEFKSKRGVIPSKKLREQFTAVLLFRRKKRAISDILSCQKSKIIATPPSQNSVEIQGPFKKKDEEEKIKYVRGERPNPHGKSWTEAKKILAVISVKAIHYRVVEILFKEGKINVYDCNEPLVDDVNFFFLVEPLMELLSILLRKSKLMNHFPKKALMKKS